MFRLSGILYTTQNLGIEAPEDIIADFGTGTRGVKKLGPGIISPRFD